MREADLQRSVVELARIFGWETMHVRPTLGGRRHGWTTSTTLKGWPDLTLIRPPRLIFAELKSATGRLTPEQQSVMDLLSRCVGVETYVWRPGDLDGIAQILKRSSQ